MQFLKSALLFAAEHENASLLVPLLLSCGADIDVQETQVYITLCRERGIHIHGYLHKATEAS